MTRMETARLESMSPDGKMKMILQEDGDIIIVVEQGNGNGGVDRFASVEFCTPFGGGGGSQETYWALVQLMGAMAQDNLEPEWSGRRPEDINPDVQREIVKWADGCRSRMA